MGLALLAIVTIRVGALFGAGTQLDGYLVGVAAPSLFLSLLATAIPSYITPKLSVLAPREASRRAGEWALFIFLSTAIVAAVIIAARTPIISVLAPGLSKESSQIAARVLAIYALSIPSTLAASAYAAYGFANGRVWTNGVSTGVYGAVWLGLLFIPAFTHSVSSVSFACVIATQIQLLVAFLCSSSRVHRPWPRWRMPAYPWVPLLAIAGVVVNVAVGKANIILDPMLGSLSGKGDVSLLVYATRFTILIVAVCGQGPSLTVLSGRTSADDRKNPLAIAALASTALIAAGIATAVAIAFEPLARIILGHGQFTQHSAAEVGRLVEDYAPAIVLMTIAWSLEATLYSMGVTWRLVLLSLPGLTVNIALSLLLLPAVGIEARPIAVTAAMLLYVVLLSRYLSNMKDGFDVARALPKQKIIELVALVALVSGISRLGGNALEIPPAVWAATALGFAGVIVLVATRSWLRDQSLPRPSVAGEPSGSTL